MPDQFYWPDGRPGFDGFEYHQYPGIFDVALGLWDAAHDRLTKMVLEAVKTAQPIISTTPAYIRLFYNLVRDRQFNRILTLPCACPAAIAPVEVVPAVAPVLEKLTLPAPAIVPVVEEIIYVPSRTVLPAVIPPPSRTVAQVLTRPGPLSFPKHFASPDDWNMDLILVFCFILAMTCAVIAIGVYCPSGGLARFSQALQKNKKEQPSVEPHRPMRLRDRQVLFSMCTKTNYVEMPSTEVGVEPLEEEVPEDIPSPTQMKEQECLAMEDQLEEDSSDAPHPVQTDPSRSRNQSSEQEPFEYPTEEDPSNPPLPTPTDHCQQEQAFEYPKEADPNGAPQPMPTDHCQQEQAFEYPKEAGPNGAPQPMPTDHCQQEQAFEYPKEADPNGAPQPMPTDNFQQQEPSGAQPQQMYTELPVYKDVYSVTYQYTVQVVATYIQVGDDNMLYNLEEYSQDASSTPTPIKSKLMGKVYETTHPGHPDHPQHAAYTAAQYRSEQTRFAEFDEKGNLVPPAHKPKVPPVVNSNSDVESNLLKRKRDSSDLSSDSDLDSDADGEQAVGDVSSDPSNRRKKQRTFGPFLRFRMRKKRKTPSAPRLCLIGPPSHLFGLQSFWFGPQSYPAGSESSSTGPQSYPAGSQSSSAGPQSYTAGPQSYTAGPQSSSVDPQSYAVVPKSCSYSVPAGVGRQANDFHVGGTLGDRGRGPVRPEKSRNKKSSAFGLFSDEE